jgi:PIN domain nuclease of toxin-antitoxin system
MPVSLKSAATPPPPVTRIPAIKSKKTVRLPKDDVTSAAPQLWEADLRGGVVPGEALSLKTIPKRMLLDTPTLDYLIRMPTRLSHNALLAVNEAGAECLVSAVSLLELAEKVRQGDYVLRCQFDEFVNRTLAHFDLTVLELSPEALRVFATLPAQPAKKVKGTPAAEGSASGADGYDLLLIAQAIAAKCPVVSPDSWFPAYAKQGLKVIW